MIKNKRGEKYPKSDSEAIRKVLTKKKGLYFSGLFHFTLNSTNIPCKNTYSEIMLC